MSYMKVRSRSKVKIQGHVVEKHDLFTRRQKNILPFHVTFQDFYQWVCRKKLYCTPRYLYLRSVPDPSSIFQFIIIKNTCARPLISTRGPRPVHTFRVLSGIICGRNLAVKIDRGGIKFDMRQMALSLQ